VSKLSFDDYLCRMRTTNPDCMRKLFLYVTTSCCLSCRHCFLSCNSSIDGGMMEVGKALMLLDFLQTRGFRMVTVTGGEPLEHPDLVRILAAATSRGYATRLNTCGAYPLDSIPMAVLRSLDVVALSLDGADSETHDWIRGTGCFESVLRNLDFLRRSSLQSKCTTTVNTRNLSQIPAIIELCGSYGVRELDIHVMSLNGTAQGIAEYEVDSTSWLAARERLSALDELPVGLSVRYPPLYITDEEVPLRKHWLHCRGMSADGISVLPSGSCHLCTLYLDSAKSFASTSDRDGLVPLLRGDRQQWQDFTETERDYGDIADGGSGPPRSCRVQRTLSAQAEANPSHINICRFVREVRT